jgi:hypothetical protein
LQLQPVIQQHLEQQKSAIETLGDVRTLFAECRLTAVDDMHPKQSPGRRTKDRAFSASGVLAETV